MVNNLNLLDFILENNRTYQDSFKNSNIMQLLDNSLMQLSSNRSKLLSCIQRFSNYFQRIIMLRLAMTDRGAHHRVAQDHFDEEYGHNLILQRERNTDDSEWDPILEACSSWFCWKIFTLDNYEKSFLIHFILESSADIFFRKADQVMQQYQSTTYFHTHAENDDRHAEMGMELIRGLSKRSYSNLLELQKEGWDVLLSLCNRIAYIVESSTEREILC